MGWGGEIVGYSKSRSRWTNWACLILAWSLLSIALTGCGNREATPAPAGTEVTAEEYFAQGNVAYQQGDLSQAAASFEAALSIDPDHLGSLTNLGVVYYQQGRLDDAALQFQTGLEVEPRDAQLYYLLGATRLQQNRLDDAETNFLKARELQPDLPEVYYGLGALYKLQGKTEQAIAAFETFLELGPAQDPQAEIEARRELRELGGE